MKTTLQTILFSGLFLSLNHLSAQTNSATETPVNVITKNKEQKIYRVKTISDAPIIIEGIEKITPKPAVVTNMTVTDVTLGCAANTYSGYGYPGLARLDYQPVGSTGVVTMTHRSGPLCTPSDGSPNSGQVRVDLSKDGGVTWNTAPSLGPLGNFSAYVARYPAGLIYNPVGNTNPDSAFISYEAPGYNTVSAEFEAVHTGAATIGNPSNFNQITDVYTGGANYMGYLPVCFTDDGFGTNYFVDMGQLPNFSLYYNDTIIIRKGTWIAPARQHFYQTIKFPFPVINSPTMGRVMNMVNIAAKGQLVYLSAMACADVTFSPDTSMYFTVWKSFNGGVNWSAPYKINYSDVNAQMGTTGEVAFTSGQMDGTIDANGNYHLTTHLAANTFMGQFSFITDATTHSINLISTTNVQSMGFGAPTAIVDYSRGQIALSPNRDKVFYVWFDKDTALYPISTSPDAMARTFDVTTGTFEPVVNLTKGTVADGKMTQGFVANWASANATCGPGSYTIHMGYQVATAGPNDPFIFHYVGGTCITSVTELNKTISNVSEVYPNPTTGISSIEIEMNKASKVSIEIRNLLGQLVYSSNENLPAGKKNLTIDASKWNSGAYFYTIKDSDFSITKKLIKE